MIEFRITADPNTDGFAEAEAHMIRAMYADDLCAAIWDIQQLLIRDMNHSEDVKKQDLAEEYLKNLNNILDETNAESAMRTYV